MIKNDKQFQVTKNRLKDFKDMLYTLESSTDDSIDPIYKKIEMDAVQSQINVFSKEIEEYELLKQGKVNYVYVDSLPNIYEALIKARIIKGWTQAELAKHLKLKEQQVQRYELDNYSTASINKISQVATALNIDFKSIKVEIAQPKFNLPADLDSESLLDGYNKMREKRTLLPL